MKGIRTTAAGLEIGNDVTCPFCGDAAELTDGVGVYGTSAVGKPYATKSFYVCRPCDARVGCHPGTTKPLGDLADVTTREARMRAHAAIDPAWTRLAEYGAISRTKARRIVYSRLSRLLGIPSDRCHVAMMDVEMCERAVAVAPFLCVTP